MRKPFKLLQTNKKQQGQFHLLLPRLHTQRHTENAILTPLQTPQFLCLRTAKYHGDVFFHFFNFFTQKHKKSQKTLALFYIFAFISFFMNRKKNLLFYKKNMYQNRYSYALNQNRHERFSSRKKTRKRAKKRFLNTFGPQKCFKNHHFFIKNEHHVFNANSLFFTVIYM